MKATTDFLEGFSKMSRDEKLSTLAHFVDDPQSFMEELESYRLTNESLQQRFEQFSENTVSNYHLPFGISPNYLIDGQIYHIPMVTEESSVVAAASKAAKFWYKHGGFQTEKISTIKRGHVHFMWYGTYEELEALYKTFEKELPHKLADLTRSMEERGGGVTEVWLSDQNDELEGYYQIGLSFETIDSMGANFINSVLEKTAEELKHMSEKHHPGKLELVMAILSNYAPGSFVQMKVECPVNNLGELSASMNGEEVAAKFKMAVDIANHSVSRAVTHNKGIMNGVDALVIATGNDFRAVEAGVHAYAVDRGRTTSLTSCEVHDGTFTFRIKIPLALGTVGGLTRLHPLASRALEILGNPSAKDLMKIAAAVGLASNFSALVSLTTTGIQKGHMKLHLENILMSLDVDEEMKEKIKEHFRDQPVSYAQVKAYIEGKL
jgi:hydroxymethylglutaryl-CoA reductase